MGYDAHVCCNCYQQGLTTPPPYSELVVSDEEGLYLNFPDGIWERNQSLCLEMEAAFDAWKSRACPHPDMMAASERLANMSGMAAFRHIVHERGGAARFPVLITYLPQANGGTLPAHYAPALLLELDLLAAEPGKEELAVLREQPAGGLLFSVNTSTYADFAFTGADGHRYRLGKTGFSILQQSASFLGIARKPAVRFHSTNFTQHYLAEGCYRFTDVATGRYYDCTIGLGVAARPPSSTTFRVALETVTLAHEYEYILIPLCKLAAAAMQTSNPICWT